MKKALYLCLLLVSICSCKKEQPHMATLNEGCDCAHEVSADFLIEEITGFNTSFEKRTPTDTIFQDRNVLFFALEDDAEYTWYLGSEIIHEQSFYRYFDFNLAGQTIDVTLVVKKQPNLICSPDDDGYDSIVKRFYISNKTIEEAFQNPYPMLEGVYRMKDKDSPDSVDITINLHYDIMQGENLQIFNYDGQGSNSPLNYYGGLVTMHYRRLWYNHNLRDNMIYHRQDGIVELNMVSNSDLEPVKSYYYLGRKIE